MRPPERRLVSRRTPLDDDPLRHIRLRGGKDGLVIDISSVGALVEGPARLLPGTGIEVQLATTIGRIIVRCRVVRSYVSGVSAEQVRYRGALRFEHAVNVAPAG